MHQHCFNVRRSFALPLLAFILGASTATHAADIYVDNTSATLTGTWTASSSVPGHYGTNYLHDGDAGKGTKTARFRPNLPSGGAYEVFVRWTADTTRSNSVPVDIVTAQGTEYLAVNQQQNSNTWVSLGVYQFSAGTAGSVLISNIGTSGFVIADAVRFTSATEVIVDNSASSGVVITGDWTTNTGAAGYYGSNYLNDGNTGQGTKSVRYTPNLPSTAWYDVRLRWTSATNRTTKAQVDITTANGPVRVTANQTKSGGEWVSLGTYRFNSGTAGNVLISNTGSNGQVIADAVSFVKTVPALTYRYFAASSFWNTKVTNAPLATDQSDVSKLVNQVAQFDTSFNTSSYSTPLYIVPANQPTITVVDDDDNYMTSRWGQVPWPSNASPASGTDRHLAIWQPETNKMWEFWSADGTYPNITSNHGGFMANVSTSNGVFPFPQGATATGLPLVGCLITMEEARKAAADPDGYVIPHVIALAVAQVAASHVAPANRHDGSNTGGTYAITEGRRYRLPPGYDPNVSMPNAGPLAKAVARAVRDYGMVIRDRSGNVTFYGEDPKTGAINPWTSTIYGGKPSYDVFDNFPWNSLQVLQP